MPREKRKEYIAYVPNNGAQRGSTVIDSNYEKPVNPDYRFKTDKLSVKKIVNSLLSSEFNE